MAAAGVAPAHISTVNRPSTLLKGPAVEPQKEQRLAIASPFSNMCSTTVASLVCRADGEDRTCA
jgi:hypothetical protein